jgi:transcriptional regulator with XRE-family HTH domain
MPELTLGQRIASLRRASGWSQRRLAQAAGVSHGYIGLLERGQLTSPGRFRLDAIARAFHLRTSDALLALDPSSTPDAEPDAEHIEGSEFLPAATGRADDAPALRDGFAARTRVEVGENVLGPVDQVRAAWARPLPIFRWGSCGDPRDRESPPDPDRLEFPPPGREMLIGPNGFGVVVRGESMAGRGIHEGDVVWVNPDRSHQVGKVVLALMTDASGAAGMVVKTFGRTEVGECLLSEPRPGERSPVVCQQFTVIGPVVGIASWRLPT